MEALYERVLALVPAPQLHENYNVVLHEELASVVQTLGDVLAAFAKLEEVHDAVSKLQQSHGSSTGGRSDSLMASADNTMELKCQLLRLVEKLGVGMEVAQVERKRKRVEEEEATIPVITPARDSGADESTRSGCSTTAKKMKRVHSESSEEATKKSAQKTKIEERDDSLSMKRAVAASSGSASGSSSESESDNTDSDEDADEVGGSEAAWKAHAMTTEAKSAPSPVKNSVKQTETDTNTAAKLSQQSAVHMDTIVGEVKKLDPLDRSFIIPELLVVMKESVEADVHGLQQSAVASSLDVLVEWWSPPSEYQYEHAGLYRKYAAVVGLYARRLPCSDIQSELYSLKAALLSSLTRHGGKSVSSKKKARFTSAIREAKKKNAFSLATISGPDTVPDRKRIRRLLEVLVAFKQETAADIDAGFGNRLIKGIGRMYRWLSEGLRRPLQLQVYRMIANAMHDFPKRIQDIATRRRAVGFLKNMSDAISDPSSSKIRAPVSRLQNRATEVCKEVMRWRNKTLSNKEAHDLVEAVKALVIDLTVGWNPFRDVIVRKCVHELKGLMLRGQSSRDIKERRSFEVRYATIVKWKVEELPRGNQ